MPMSRSLTSCVFLIAAAVSSAQTFTNQSALNDISQRAYVASQAKREQARFMAKLLGIPMKQVFPGGKIMEIVEFRDGRPLYYITDNENAAKTSRADKLWPGGEAGLSL